MNKHFRKAESIADYSATHEASRQQEMSLQEAQVEATLALAYEQRTALLMAYASAIDNTDESVYAQIKERLNLA